MGNWGSLLVAAVLAAGSTACSAVVPVSGGTADVIVRFDPERVAPDLGHLRSQRARQVLKGRIEGFEMWRVDRAAEAEIGTLLASLPGVRYARPNRSRRIQSAASSPAPEPGQEQWHLGQIRAIEAWERFFPTGEPGKGVMVAILDTGIDVRHPYLEANIARGEDGKIRYFDELQDSVSDGETPLTRGCGATFDWRTAYQDSRHPGPDGNGHGTHVAGILAARKPGEMLGVAPYASILPVKAMDCTGNGDDWSIANALIHSADAGAKILNLSIGGPKPGEPVLEDAIDYATNRGALLIMAAGNGFGEQVYYPAAYPGILAVGAVDREERVAPYSNVGPRLEVVAPGGSLPMASGGVLSTIPTYRSLMSGELGGAVTKGRATGTSQAAPQVAGIAALIWSREPTLSASQVKLKILASAKDLGAAGRDDESGWGRVDAVKALEMSGHSF